MSKKIRSALERTTRFLRYIYLKFLRLNDSPRRIAIGFGLGVFVGVMPGVGPVAALVLAAILRVNGAAALLGSLFTNTWLIVPMFAFSVRVGALITGVDYVAALREWSALTKTSGWSGIVSAGASKIVLAVVIGYLALAIAASIIACAVAFLAAHLVRSQRTKKSVKNS